MKITPGKTITLEVSENELMCIRAGISAMLAVQTCPTEAMLEVVVIPMINSMCEHQQQETMQVLDELNEIKIAKIKCINSHD